MRLSLPLFISLCLVCNITNAQKIRLKSLQLGPTLGVEISRQDTTIAKIRALVKEPQRFPVSDVDTLDRTPGHTIFYNAGSQAQFSLLTTWEFLNGRKEKPFLQKEWRIGLEYSYYGHSSLGLDTYDYTGQEPKATTVSFFRVNHFLGLYSDFIFKKGFSHNRISLFAGAGGYLAYSLNGKIKETKGNRVGNNVVTEEFSHPTHGRRDIAMLFPLGIDMRSGNPRRPLGVTLGIRPGFMIQKEKMLSSFTTGMIGFTARMVYHFH